MSSKLPPGFFESKGPSKTSNPPPGPRQTPKTPSSSKIPAGFFDSPQSSGQRPASEHQSTKAPSKAQAQPRGTVSGNVKVGSQGVLQNNAPSNSRKEKAPPPPPAAAVTTKPPPASDPRGHHSPAAPGTKKTGTAQAGSKLPEGFFDDVKADSKARGIELKKPDIKDELQEFEKSIKRDLDEARQREDEEEAEAADEREERETLAQREMREKVARFREQLRSKRKRNESDASLDETSDAKGSGSDVADVNGSRKHLRPNSAQGEGNGEGDGEEENSEGVESEDDGDEADSEEDEDLDVALQSASSFDWRAKCV